MFVEGVDEITDMFGSDRGFETSLERIGTAADVYPGGSHSDDGGSFTEFTNWYLDAVSPRTIIIKGDARTHYRSTAVNGFRMMSDRARVVFWLNPDPERFWDTGYSAIGYYAPQCDRTEEVRSLQQLERFIEWAVFPITRGLRLV